MSDQNNLQSVGCDISVRNHCYKVIQMGYHHRENYISFNHQFECPRRRHDGKRKYIISRREQSTDMGGVPSSSLSVERLQGAEVVSAHLKISGGSRPAELFSDGYISRALCDPQNSPYEFSVEFSFLSAYNFFFIMPESYTRSDTYNIGSSEIHAFFTVSSTHLPITDDFLLASSNSLINQKHFFRSRSLSSSTVVEF